MMHQYIGARYVPKFYENSLDPQSCLWESNVTYEPLTMVVLPNQHAYISKKTVPDTVGSPADNAEYWLETGNANAYIADLDARVTDIEDNQIPNLQSEIDLTLTGDQLYNALRKLNHHKIMVVGDSLCDNDTYPPNWLDKVKECITDNDLDITINTDLCIDGSSWCGFANDLTVFDPYTTDQFDIVLVCLGINDYQGQFYCGIYSDTSLSQYGTYNLVVGIKNVLEKIRTKFPNAKQFGIIPHRSNRSFTRTKPLTMYRYVIGTTLLRYGVRIIDWSSLPMFAPSVLGTFNDYVTAGDQLHIQSTYAPILAAYTMEKISDGGDSTWANTCDELDYEVQESDATGRLRVAYYSNGVVQMLGREILANAAHLSAGYNFSVFKGLPREIIESLDDYAANFVVNQTIPAPANAYGSSQIAITLPSSLSVQIVDYARTCTLKTPQNWGYNIID